MTENDQPEASDCDGSIAEAVRSNGQLLEQLLGQFDDLRRLVSAQADSSHASCAHEEGVDPSPQLIEYERRIEELEQKICDLEGQNSDLASRVANSSVRQTVACVDSGSSDALSWEDRKQLILQQMEQDCFDAEAFVEELAADSKAETFDPAEVDPADFIEQLRDEVLGTRSELERRDAEIHELRSLLDSQSETRDGGVAIGAAAIAELVDSDELVQQERERLQELQKQWEEKFRETEIEASLERAKLSRERLELARKNAELEEQLEHLRREARHDEETGPSSRRWLAKLGLAD